MKTLVRWDKTWNPFKEMEDLQGRMNRLMGSAFGRLPLSGEGEPEEALRLAEWAPPVDISEDEKEYLIKMELPEVKREDLSVTVENGVLTITGERKVEKEEQGKRYHRMERAYGTFTRSFTLPDQAEAGKVNAEFKEGVLHVHVGKSEKAKPKAIEVKVG